MLWIDDHKGVWRAAVLVLLVVAVVGPWTFDRIYMPAEYPCRAPSVRLEGEFCGIPLAGAWVFSQVVAAFMNLLVGLFTGATAFTDLVGDLPLFLFFGLIQLMVVLPFLSTLLLILRDGRRSGQAFHLALWGLAAGACLLLGISHSGATPRYYRAQHASPHILKDLQDRPPITYWLRARGCISLAREGL
jgi:hypothetical protein